MKSSSTLIPLVIATALVSGCTTTHRFVVDAIHAEDTIAAPTSYRLVSPITNRSAELGLFDQVQDHVRTALASKGMFEAPAGTNPEVEVEIDYGMETPVKSIRTQTEPVYIVPAFGAGMSGRGGAPTWVSPMQHPPYKVSERTLARVVVEYPKFLRLTARHLGTPDSPPSRRELWSLTVSNRDESDDLGKYLPLMVTAAMDLIGTDTGGNRTVVLKDDDSRALPIAGGLKSTLSSDL